MIKLKNLITSIIKKTYKNHFCPINVLIMFTVLFAITALVFNIYYDELFFYSDIPNSINLPLKILRASSKKYSPKLRGEYIIPPNDEGEGFFVYACIYFVVWLGVEYLFYRLEEDELERLLDTQLSDEFEGRYDL